MVHKLCGLKTLVGSVLAYTGVDIWYELRDIPRYVGRDFDSYNPEIPHF